MPISVGDHIRRKRLELELTQKEVANQLKVVSWAILNWEKGHTEPPISAFPAIIKFLGYDPFPEPETIPEHLFAKRRAMGWSIEDAATTLGIDPGTWGNWERGKTTLYRKHRERVARFLDLPVDALDQVMASRWNRSHERAL